MRTERRELAIGGKAKEQQDHHQALGAAAALVEKKKTKISFSLSLSVFQPLQQPRRCRSPPLVFRRRACCSRPARGLAPGLCPRQRRRRHRGEKREL